MAKKEIFLEDAILDDLRGLEVVERPLSSRVFVICGWIVGIFLFVIVIRVFFFGIINHSSYQSRAFANAGQEIIKEAPRGVIFDRYGVALVSNQPTFHVSINASQILKDRDSIDTTLDSIYSIVPFDMSSVRTSIFSIDLEHQAYIPIVRNINISEVIELKKLNNPAIVIEDGFSRSYQDGVVFSHAVGYTSLVSGSDISHNTNLELNDEIGKSGIESSYDALLRGINGRTIVYRDSKGNVIDERQDKAPVGGAEIHTTLDAELQKVMYESLTKRLTDLGRWGGVGIAIDPSNGEILSLVSVPSFDNNTLSASIFSDPHKPTFNRAISGVYSPGSTIKPLVAFAALEEKVIDPLKSIFSAGYIEVPNPYNPGHPSRFVDWKPQGWVNLYSALARSSNVYFYEVGGGFQGQQGLGITKLREYWQKFLINKKTGVDIKGEVEGILPDPVEREKRTGNPWRLGDTYNASIGQGDLGITPLALIRYIGGVALKGELYRPHIVSFAQSSSGDRIYTASSTYDVIQTNDPRNWDEVELGMKNAVDKDYGTAHLLSSIPMVIAGKTGSAQIQNNAKVNAFVVAYAPVPNPKIAVVILIEDAKEGSLNAVPVARDVLSWYYEHRIKTGNTN